MKNFTSARDRQVLELVKNKEHFLVVYPNTPAGRLATKGAVRDWLVGRELDFDSHDADMLAGRPSTGGIFRRHSTASPETDERRSQEPLETDPEYEVFDYLQRAAIISVRKYSLYSGLCFFLTSTLTRMRSVDPQVKSLRRESESGRTNTRTSAAE